MGVQMTVQFWVIVGLMVLAIALLGSFLASLYRKAGPHEALIVYGFRGTRIVKGHGTVIFPMVESYRQLSLELMSFDVAPVQDLYTKQGVAVTVEAVAQIKVKSDRVDSDGVGAVPDQAARPAREPDPAGDGGPPARHHRAADRRADRQGAGDGRRSHAIDLRRRHEQDGSRGRVVHHQRSPRQERVHRQHGPARRGAHQARRRRRRRRGRPRHGNQARRSPRAPQQSPRRRPTRSGCSPKRCRRRSRRRRSATSRSRRRSTSRRQAPAGAGGQGVRDPDQRHAAAGDRRGGQASSRSSASSRSRCRKPRSSAARRS